MADPEVMGLVQEMGVSVEQVLRQADTVGTGVTQDRTVVQEVVVEMEVRMQMVPVVLGVAVAKVLTQVESAEREGQVHRVELVDAAGMPLELAE